MSVTIYTFSLSVSIESEPPEDWDEQVMAVLDAACEQLNAKPFVRLAMT